MSNFTHTQNTYTGIYGPEAVRSSLFKNTARSDPPGCLPRPNVQPPCRNSRNTV